MNKDEIKDITLKEFERIRPHFNGVLKEYCKPNKKIGKGLVDERRQHIFDELFKYAKRLMDRYMFEQRRGLDKHEKK